MKHLQGLTVLVLGLGDSGLAMARWSARCGAAVRVWDSRESPPQAETLAAQVPQALLVKGELNLAAFDGVQLVLKSPGLSPIDARIAEPLRTAIEQGILVQGELDLFVRALADLKAESGYAPKVLAITGTNGNGWQNHNCRSRTFGKYWRIESKRNTCTRYLCASYF